MFSLYIHIPFCTKKCHYCHFFVLPNEESLQIQYMQSLKLEWDMRKLQCKGQILTSIYFGGGTPSLIGPERLNEILNWIKDDFTLASDVEITLEANPEDVTLEKMKRYYAAGVNRVSIGVQTLDNTLLSLLGRCHHADKAVQAIYHIADAGIYNISADLMYDLPDQTVHIWNNTLKQIGTLPLTHLSLYNLTLEPHTVFFKQKKDLIKRLPNADASLEMYKSAIEFFAEVGLKQYEISAFAKQNYYSKHNTGYWTARPFIGLGPSAFSYWNGVRFRNVANLNKYSKHLSEQQFPIDFEEELNGDARLKELLAINLRLIEGVNLDAFQKKHGILSEETLDALETFTKNGWIEQNGSTFAITSQGVLFYDTIAAEII